MQSVGLQRTTDAEYVHLGLRWDDLDFDKRIISVNYNLTDRPYEDGKFARHIQTPKTRAGARTIPMIDEVFAAFLQEYEMQKYIPSRIFGVWII